MARTRGLQDVAASDIAPQIETKLEAQIAFTQRKLVGLLARAASRSLNMALRCVTRFRVGNVDLEVEHTPSDPAVSEAQRLLRRTRDAVLCTISARVAGFPFGSTAPYALDRFGRPILLISSIAEHTKNIRCDPRVSLFVQETAGAGEQQASGRITLMGRACLSDSSNDASNNAGGPSDIRARYLARIPSASGYFDAHDFEFYTLTIEHVRFIGGFGRIFWLDPKQFLMDPDRDPLLSERTRIIDHMNHDHAESLVLFCRVFRNIAPRAAQMVGVDQFGFDVESSGPDFRLRFDFDTAVSPATIRHAMVDLVKRAGAEEARGPR